ncbi:unnamed protein product [Camellia sinensis]
MRDGQCTSGCHRVGDTIDTGEAFKASAWTEEKVLAWIWEWPITLYHTASRSRDKDIEAMQAEVEALCEKRQKDHDELMKEREERERRYNEMLQEREVRIKLANEMLKEQEEGQKAREETNTKVKHLNNVVAKLPQLLGI